MTYIYNILSSYLDNQMLYLGCASINQNTGKLIAPHLIYRLCTLWFQDDSLCIKRFLSFGCEKTNSKSTEKRNRIWAGLQCAVNTLLMDTPWTTFLQVITLCGWPHDRHSVIYPSYERTDRNPFSRMCLWFNRLKQADDFVFVTAT